MYGLSAMKWRGLGITFSIIACFIFFTASVKSVPESLEQKDLSQASSVKATLLSDHNAVVPGKALKLAVELETQPGWHIYYRESGDAGMPTQIIWDLPKGFKASTLLWEKPHKFNDSGIVTYGYSGKTIIVSEITVPADLGKLRNLKFLATVKWLSCKDVCVPGQKKLEISLPVAESKIASTTQNTAQFELANFDGPAEEIQSNSNSQQPSTPVVSSSISNTKFKIDSQSNGDGNLWTYLGLAFIGGFILNFMPCVLPVISIKVFSLIKQSGEDPRRVIQHGVVFTLGIVLSFLALAGLVIALQGAGQKIGWGFQFQYPVFVLAMAAVVTLFALSMFGLFYIQIRAGQSQIDKLASSEGLTGTFFKGVLATVLSTPCTAPFLGTALGFAFAQPWWLILLIFFTISLGMSSPYILLTIQPGWMKYLPRPGDWMERFKEGMGFLLLATVVWLLWVLANQVGIDASMAALAFLVCLSLAAWLVGSFLNLSSSSSRIITVRCLALLVLGLSYFFFLRPFPELLSSSPAVAKATEKGGKNLSAEGIKWQPFSIAELDKLAGEKKTIFVDFTADWCLTCKANEQLVLNTAPVIDKIKALNIVSLKADWTSQSPEITGLLQKFGRSGVPLYVVFPAGRADEPIVLPEIIDQSVVLTALEKAGASK